MVAVGGFDKEDFVADVVAAAAEADAVGAVRLVIERAISEPGALERAFPMPLDPDDDGILHRAPDLFITHVVFPRGFRTGIHDHRIPAVIGTWGGYEDNHLYRRTARGIEATGSRRVGAGDTLVLDPKSIHDVQAPDASWSAALHVYLGDLPAIERSAWSVVDGPECRYDGDDTERRWLEAATATGLVTQS